MAANTIDVEPVADVDAPSQPIDALDERTHASTIYQLQLAFMVARVSALEDELSAERERHQRVVQRYERLLEDRDAEIRRLRNADRGLLSALRE